MAFMSWRHSWWYSSAGNGRLAGKVPQIVSGTAGIRLLRDVTRMSRDQRSEAKSCTVSRLCETNSGMKDEQMDSVNYSHVS
jgi:hypothetical protein